MGRWWALIASIAFCIYAREASACSFEFEPASVRPLDDEFFPHGVPANRLFYRDSGEPAEVFENWSGPLPMFEVDQVWTIRANRGTHGHDEFLPDLTAFRLVDPDAYVDERVEWECGEFEPQTCSLELGPIDLEPPSRPVISDVNVTIYRTRGETAFGCGNTETMDSDADVEDAQTDPQHLYLLGCMGDDEEDLTEEDEPEIMFWPWRSRSTRHWPSAWATTRVLWASSAAASPDASGRRCVACASSTTASTRSPPCIPAWSSSCRGFAQTAASKCTSTCSPATAFGTSSPTATSSFAL